MGCPSCGHDNRPERRFCAECGARLGLCCTECGESNEPGEKFCGRCGRALTETGPRPPTPEPRSYTPKHLAEKILTSRSALEGERKTITALFADVRGSVALSESVDPETLHKIMDRFFMILADGVHRFEGTMSQYTGDGSWPCSVLLSPMRTTHDGPVIRRCICAASYAATQTSFD